MNEESSSDNRQSVPAAPIIDSRLPITNYRLPITDYRLPIADCRLPIADSIGDYQLPILRSSIADHRSSMCGSFDRLLRDLADVVGRQDRRRRRAAHARVSHQQHADKLSAHVEER